MSWIGLLAILVTFTVVVFVHELGHYLMAKKFNVRVEKFSIGIGPELFGFWKGETRFSVSAIPLGGFVKMSGEEPSECVGSPREFYSQPWHRRLGLVAAGPGMNIVLAFVLAWLGFVAWGAWVPSKDATVGEVMSPSAAERSGLKSGDVILAVSGQVVRDWSGMSALIRGSAGKSLDLVVLRGDERLTLWVKPEWDPKRKAGFIGITPVFENRKLGIFSAFKAAALRTLELIVLIFVVLYKIVTGGARPDLYGPVGIGALIAKSAHQGISPLMDLVSVLSANLGVVNLLPIPVLDGGHAMFCFIQAATRKPISAKKMQIANAVGMAVLFVLIGFALYSDFARFAHGRFPWSTPESQPVP